MSVRKVKLTGETWEEIRIITFDSEEEFQEQIDEIIKNEYDYLSMEIISNKDN